MPTGYTELLKEKKYNIEKWLTEDIIRNFGVCVTMREMPSLTSRQIEQMLERDLILKTPTKKTKKLTEKELKEQYEKEIAKIKSKIKQIKKEELENINTICKIKKMILANNSKDELVTNALNYALEQLELVKIDFDTSYYEKELEATFEEYKEARRRQEKRELEYEKQYTKDKKASNKARYEAYKQYVKEIKELCKEITENENEAK